MVPPRGMSRTGERFFFRMNGTYDVLIAVHLAEGVMTWPWLAFGFAVAAGLLVWSSGNLDHREIPRIALLSAAFFVASLIHVRVGPSSVHLILNGLLGVILGRRAILAISVGLFLQAILLGHGGLSTLGLNISIMSIPALLARSLFFKLEAATPTGFHFTPCGVVAVLTLLWSAFIGLAAVAPLIARRRGRSIEHQQFVHSGFVIGGFAVVLTTVLNAAVLLLGGNENWSTVAVFVLLAHVPIAFLEGLITGGVVGFLMRVRPELFSTKTDT